jgi:alpha-galactosidase
MRKKKLTIIFLSFLIIITGLIFNCTQTPQYSALISGKNISVYFDQQLHSLISSKFDNSTKILGNYQPSEYVMILDNPITDFQFKSKSQKNLQDRWGKGHQLIVTGESEKLRKEVSISIYDDFPMMAVYQVRYTNIGETELVITGWINNQFQIKISPTTRHKPLFWSFQSGSYENRPDWVLSLKPGFKQENYMGMNATDYGGGTPVVDIWRPDVGIAVGSLELTPRILSLPVIMQDSLAAELQVKYQGIHNLQPGEVLETYKTFVAVHQGDFFQTLSEYRKFMEKGGLTHDPFPDSAYDPIWCAWGYRRNFTMEQIYGTLPIVKELGFKWAVLDDGWQTAEGDWYLNKSKFPGGDKDMITFVNKIKEYGLRPKLWWSPLAVDPGTDLIKEHPEYLLLNKDGSKQDISWWNSYYLCPAYPPVQEYTKKLVEKFMVTWGFEGLKIDGQHLNAAPPCYNPAHNHAYPEESFEKIPEFFRIIYETALNILPDAVVEICPCGTAYAFHTMRYMNQPVASDPESSWQIRLKGKTFKALMGPQVPYYGDHVELSDGRDDFASSVGIGAVIGTKFTWPVGAMKKSDVNLTPEKVKVWKKWIDIYLDNMLPKGQYRGDLYDIGFDRPEAHAIQKNGKFYYAFYCDSYEGEVELRGLKNQTYQVTDYENDKEFGVVQGNSARIPVVFKKHLLLVAKPQ